MVCMPEEVFVRHCSPTLAGIKTANLFSCRFADEKEMRDSVRRLNGVLVKKGVRVLPPGTAMDVRLFMHTDRQSCPRTYSRLMPAVC